MHSTMLIADRRALALPMDFKAHYIGRANKISKTISIKSHRRGVEPRPESVISDAIQ